MKLVWQDDRWHCGGMGIHAGDVMELRGDDDLWFPVRIESFDRGRVLIAYTLVHGLDFTRRINEDYDELRWPN